MLEVIFATASETVKTDKINEKDFDTNIYLSLRSSGLEHFQVYQAIFEIPALVQLIHNHIYDKKQQIHHVLLQEPNNPQL